MRQLIYVSRVVPGLQDEDALLRSILEVSVRNNTAVAVSGMLLRHRDHFFQALEGSAAAVEAIYRRVRRDPRHQDLKLLQDATPTSRSFAGWAMCGHNMGPADNEILEVLALRRGFDPQRISGPGALSLLRTVHAVQQRVDLRAQAAVVIEA
ncbi:BLUF domain-containing protein [Brevundimonas sanguinis]|uniref:BLUF domain-containing protein n=1 Tax=Brevundimonas sanguinis TaxID=3021811 RepID=UPI002415619C|nr:BLUF domain-containing protein [Brevundimonas sp. NCCP 15609]